MAYTRAWSTTTPADSDQASSLGQAIRNLRGDIEERMDTLLNSGWSSDPVAGFPVTKVLYIAPAAGLALESVANWEFLTGGGLSVAPKTGASNVHFIVPFTLPVGVTLTKVRVAAFIATGTSGTSKMHAAGVYTVVAVTGNPASPTSLGSTSDPSADSNWHWQDASISSHVVAAGDIFSVDMIASVATTNDCGFGGLEVTYTVPDLITGY